MGRPRKKDPITGEVVINSRELKELQTLRSDLSLLRDENARLSQDLYIAKTQLMMLEKDVARFKLLIETQNAQTQSVVELRAFYTDTLKMIKEENARLRKDLAHLGSRRADAIAVEPSSTEEQKS